MKQTNNEDKLHTKVFRRLQYSYEVRKHVLKEDAIVLKREMDYCGDEYCSEMVKRIESVSNDLDKATVSFHTKEKLVRSILSFQIKNLPIDYVKSHGKQFAHLIGAELSSRVVRKQVLRIIYTYFRRWEIEILQQHYFETRDRSKFIAAVKMSRVLLKGRISRCNSGASRFFQQSWRQVLIHRRELRNNAAVFVQRFIRGHLRRVYFYHLKQISCASKIQLYMRYYLWKRRRQCCIYIQTYFRRHVFRQISRIKLQSFIRMAACRRKYVSTIRSFVRLQAKIRGFRGKQLYLLVLRDHTDRVDASLNIQRVIYHGCRGRKMADQRKRLVKSIYIQSIHRMVMAKFILHHAKNSASKISAIIRQRLIRKRYIKFRYEERRRHKKLRIKLVSGLSIQGTLYLATYYDYFKKTFPKDMHLDTERGKRMFESRICALGNSFPSDSSVRSKWMGCEELEYSIYTGRSFAAAARYRLQKMYMDELLDCMQVTFFCPSSKEYQTFILADNDLSKISNSEFSTLEIASAKNTLKDSLNYFVFLRGKIAFSWKLSRGRLSRAGKMALQIGCVLGTRQILTIYSWVGFYLILAYDPASQQTAKLEINVNQLASYARAIMNCNRLDQLLSSEASIISWLLPRLELSNGSIKFDTQVRKATCTIANVWRKYQAFKLFRKVAMEIYQKLFDPKTRSFYYYNSITHEVSWTKPKCLSTLDIPPLKRLLWEEYIDAQGVTYYYNTFTGWSTYMSQKVAASMIADFYLQFASSAPSQLHLHFSKQELFQAREFLAKQDSLKGKETLSVRLNQALYRFTHQMSWDSFEHLLEETPSNPVLQYAIAIYMAANPTPNLIESENLKKMVAQDEMSLYRKIETYVSKARERDRTDQSVFTLAQLVYFKYPLLMSPESFHANHLFALVNQWIDNDFEKAQYYFRRAAKTQLSNHERRVLGRNAKWLQMQMKSQI